MKDKEKTNLILSKLRQHFTSWGRGRTNIIFPELRLGSGYCGVAQRRIDLFIISSNAGNETTAFEIKVSKQDFKKDIDNDLKQRGARLYSNYFYYVAPKGLIKPEEVPLWAGLLELDLLDEERVKNGWFVETVPAPLHSKAMPSWGLICSMIRHINKDIGKTTIEEQEDEIRKLKLQIESQTKLLTKIARGEELYGWELQRYKL